MRMGKSLFDTKWCDWSRHSTVFNELINNNDNLLIFIKNENDEEVVCYYKKNGYKYEITVSSWRNNEIEIIKLYDYMKLNQAISTFQSDLYFVRESNMLSNPLTLRIYHKQNYYVILQNGTKIILNRQLPTGVTIPANLNMTDIRFNNLGHTTSGRTLTMQSEQFKKNIVFSIGIGGIDIRDAN